MKQLQLLKYATSTFSPSQFFPFYRVTLLYILLFNIIIKARYRKRTVWNGTKYPVKRKKPEGSRTGSYAALSIGGALAPTNVAQSVIIVRRISR